MPPANEPIDPTLEIAIFGRQVEDFLKSDVGDYLINRAKDEAEEAMDLLKNTHPWRKRRIQQLQNQIKVAESIKGWLGGAVAAGIQATRVLEGE
jgi:hypothetical protein